MEQVFEEQKQVELFIEELNLAMKEGLIDDWKTEHDSVLRNNTYLEKDGKIESQLEALRENLHVTLYKMYDDKLGEAGFEFSLSGEKEEFRKEIEDAAFITKENTIKSYTLPKKEDISVSDEHIDYEKTYSKKLAKSLEEGRINLEIQHIITLFKTLIEKHSNSEKTVILNSLELFTKFTKRTLKNSKGIDKTQYNTGVYLDIALSARDEQTKKEVEHLLYEHINNIEQFNFKEFFEEAIQNVKDKLDAQSMISFSGPILLSHAAAVDFFFSDQHPSPPLAHVAGRLKYEGISHYEKGQEILKAKKDKLTFSIQPLLEGNAHATAFDTDGISAKTQIMIKENVVQEFLATKQYADYLGLGPSGPPGIFVVEGGEKSENALREEEEYIEIVSFAWFNPSSISGDVSAEIRLAYHVKNGVKTPMKEGLFSGNIFKFLEEISFSKEQINVPGYVGPKVIKCFNAKIISS